MYRFFLAAFLLVQPLTAFAQKLDLSGYQNTDGSITTGYGGDKVDPYFATKALLTAYDYGFDIKQQADDWISWALKMQRPDGLFERYAKSENGWQSYASTDADDAMSALWIELLYNQSPKNGLPKTWQESAARAEAQLEKLYSSERGIYYISSSMPVGLLMDNIEIYSAFKRIALDQQRLGSFKNAELYAKKADNLAEAILKNFRPNDTDDFLITTQVRDENDFYPDKVGQLYPLLYNLPEQQKNFLYSNWVAMHEQEWINHRMQDYPWGIVALLALKMQDTPTALCWQNRAEPLRYSGRWNVLEEVALQSVKLQLASINNPGIPCVGKIL